MLSLSSLLLFSCEKTTKANELKDEATLYANQLILELRSKRWSSAAEMCLVDEHAIRRFGAETMGDEQTIRAEIAELFRHLYENTPPGAIFGVDIDPQNTGDLDFVRVSYSHGDIDAFSMRKTKGRWYYSFE